ncbi:unnamed protein product [Chilo suppressalis]|uniref:C2H2-type domain-containing protein n=1 Tax=Chilo suppressalis TaxID=168631 RepID=A0ABN8BBH4_CHISP|nr:hypothetical protein evm_011350 [Chilo suppressalis]CAH0406075.1 unnamed protein product [Chilo suppressalis]
MSATAASLPCPLCAHCSVFESVQALRDRLIYVSTNKILCPVCQEEVSGLDKLTIHLFSHVKIINMKKYDDQQQKLDIQNTLIDEKQRVTTAQQKKPRPTSKNKAPSSVAATPVKYVKIYPKLPVVSMNTLPVIDVSHIGTTEENSLTTLQAIKSSTLVKTNTTCDVCGLQFVNADILKMHRCLIHNIDENANQNITRYQCHLCPKNFKMRGSLMVHLRVAHYGFLSGYSSDTKTEKEGQNGISNEQSSEHKVMLLQRNENKQWQCDVCRKSFTTKYFLKKHKRLHTGETPYSCSQCNKTFTFQQSYHKHLLYHNDEKPHSCNYCGRAFKELSTLHNHLRIHTGEKPFSCETCGKCFRQRVSYLVHRRIHTGVMPYKCTACEKSFRYKVSQRTHKCSSKPPGTVIRQSGDLVEKLKKKQGVSEDFLVVHAEPSTGSTNYLEVSEANAELVRTGAKLSWEDMESDNFTLIADTYNTNKHEDHNKEASCSTVQLTNNQISENTHKKTFDSNLDALIDTIPATDKSIPSPSEILKKLCLSKEDDILNILEDPESDKNYDLYKDFEVFM